MYNSGIFLRRNTSISIFNSIILGWKKGVLIDARTGTPTDNNITDNSLRIKNITIGSNIEDVKYTASTLTPTGASDASMLSWFSTINSLNTIVTNASDASLSSPYATTPDFKPTQTVFNSGTFNGTLGSINGFNFNSNASFTDAYLQDAFFINTSYRGAAGLTGSDSNWWVGWTVWN